MSDLDQGNLLMMAYNKSNSIAIRKIAVEVYTLRQRAYLLETILKEELSSKEEVTN